MTRHLFLRTTLALFLSLSAGSLSLAPACGNELEQPDQTLSLNDVKGGRLLFKTAQPGRYLPAPTLKTDVRISVTGLIARATVSQEFLNPSLKKNAWAEGIYVFPLPETAAVDHLRMKIGERIIEGQINEKAEAKKVYEQAKQAGKRTSLIEQERPNIFTTSVANIGPGERITVEIEYQETIRYDQGAFSLRFPLVVGPRYIPGTAVVMEEQPPGNGWSLDTDRVPDASRITPPVQHPNAGPINLVSLNIALAPGFPLGKLESASHQILTIAEPDGGQHITLREDAVPDNRDFVLTWHPASGQAPTVSVFREQRGNDQYAFLMAMPPIGSNHQPTAVARETIFVIDTSGSMSGTSIEQAKAALLLALNRLTAQDRFNVIQFNSVTHVLFSQAQPVKPETLRKAVHYVEQLKANGGTEILPALKMALKGSAQASHLRQVIFLTDGQVGNEDELFEIIRAQLGTSRLFTIGIGSAPNSHFMRKAAEFGRGTFTHIGSTSEVQAQMDAIFRKLERPVLTDLRIDGINDQIEMFPPRIPDLYEGEPVAVVLKGKSLPEIVTIKGIIGSAPWTTSITLKNREPREGLSVFWARQKIATLMDQQRYGQDEAATKQAVLDEALSHHLVSKYSSLVAVDVTPVRPADKLLQPHAMKTNLPDGQDYQAIFGLPQTATSGQLRILLGLETLLAAWLIWTLRGKNRMNPIRPTPRTLTALTVFLLAISLWQIGEGSWIYAKAGLAQHLLQRAWSRTLAGETGVKPWPWADTWPVARLLVPSQHIDQIVLEGAYGRTLAFGPGHVESAGPIGTSHTVILTGHRDTHFGFLQQLEQNDVIEMDTTTGIRRRYRVKETRIADSRSTSIGIKQDQPQLVLITCYPFDSPMPGTLWRYVVIAEGEQG